MKIAGYKILLGESEYRELTHNPNKEYVAGYLIGRAQAMWLADKEEVKEDAVQIKETSQMDVRK